jgi:hypothetical protein
MNALPINDIAEGGLILTFRIAYPFTGARTVSPMFLQNYDKSMQWLFIICKNADNNIMKN